MDISIALFALLVLISFLAEMIDSSLGMGYGTLLSPLLLTFLGFPIFQIVPAILLTEIFSGLLGGFLHWRAGNLVFQNASFNTYRILLILVICSLIGTLISSLFIINLSEFWVKLYIGILIVAMGIFILSSLNKQYKFSYKKIIILGTIASFNKSISGGGYGPIIVSGQILSGVNSKNAIGITAISEGVVSILAFSMYLLLKKELVDLTLAVPLCIGSIASVPFSVFIVKRMNVKYLKLLIACLTSSLGIYTLIKLFIK